MPFQPYIYKAIVTKVYDGDTFTVGIDLGFYIAYNEQVIRLVESILLKYEEKSEKRDLKYEI
jgi:hypothetical protein